MSLNKLGSETPALRWKGNKSTAYGFYSLSTCVWTSRSWTTSSTRRRRSGGERGHRVQRAIFTAGSPFRTGKQFFIRLRTTCGLATPCVYLTEATFFTALTQLGLGGLAAGLRSASRYCKNHAPWLSRGSSSRCLWVTRLVIMCPSLSLFLVYPMLRGSNPGMDKLRPGVHIHPVKLLSFWGFFCPPNWKKLY